ncbi:MAG: LysR family transcriptional regulator [Acidiferrobacter sp.]
MRTKTSLKQWAILAAVVDHGGFSQAAEALRRSQSAISYAAAHLQEALDIPLLTVVGRKAILTPHGETLLKRARTLLADLETLELLAHSLKQGWEPILTLVVDAAFPREHLLRIVAELQGLCPNTQLQLSDAVLSGAEEAITDGSADVVVTTRVPPGFLGEWLFDVTFIAVAHADHPLLQLNRPLTSKDLRRHTQSVVRDSGVKHPRGEGWLGSNLHYTFSNMEASRAAVQAGLAYAWLPAHCIEEPLRQGVLRPLPLVAGTVRKVSLYLVLIRPELAGPAAHAVVECFRRHIPILAKT